MNYQRRIEVKKPQENKVNKYPDNCFTKKSAIKFFNHYVLTDSISHISYQAVEVDKEIITPAKKKGGRATKEKVTEIKYIIEVFIKHLACPLISPTFPKFDEMRDYMTSLMHCCYFVAKDVDRNRMINRDLAEMARRDKKIFSDEEENQPNTNINNQFNMG